MLGLWRVPIWSFGWPRITTLSRAWRWRQVGDSSVFSGLVEFIIGDEIPTHLYRNYFISHSFLNSEKKNNQDFFMECHVWVFLVCNSTELKGKWILKPQAISYDSSGDFFEFFSWWKFQMIGEGFVPRRLWTKGKEQNKGYSSSPSISFCRSCSFSGSFITSFGQISIAGSGPKKPQNWVSMIEVTPICWCYQ